MPRYFMGKGRLFFANKNATTGLPGDFTWLGNVSKLTLNTNQAEVEHKESYTGLNLTDKVISTGQKADAAFTIEEMTRTNLTYFLFGTGTGISAASVTNEAVVCKVNGYVSLANINISAFTSLTLGVSPFTVYVNGTDYTINMGTGMIFFPSNTTIADNASLRANYSFGAAERISAFTGIQNPIYWLRFDGLNQAEGNIPVVIDIYSFRPKPVGSMELLNEDFLKLDITGMALYEDRMPDNTSDGRFFRIRQTLL